MKKLVFAGVTALALLLSTVPEGQTAAPAHMAWTRNVVQYARGGRWVNAYRGLALNSGAYVRTGSNSRAQIHYADGSVMRLGSRSIARIRYLGSKNVTVNRGKAYFKVNKQRQRMKVRTRTAVATVLGTEFVVEVNDTPQTCQQDCGDQTRITTLEGNVGVSGAEGGPMIEVPAGMTTEVGEGDEPSPPQPASQEDLNPEGLPQDDGPDSDLANGPLDPSNPQQQNLIQNNGPGSQGPLENNGALMGELEITIQ